MKRDFRLFELDQLDSDHFPVIAFFNAISNSDFKDVVEQLSLGIGRGINAAVCTFPDDLDPDEDMFDGVMFSLHNEEVVVDYQTFFHYLKKACNFYLVDFPDDKDIIESYLSKIKEKYHLVV